MGMYWAYIYKAGSKLGYKNTSRSSDDTTTWSHVLVLKNSLFLFLALLFFNLYKYLELARQCIIHLFCPNGQLQKLPRGMRPSTHGKCEKCSPSSSWWP